MRMSAAVQRVLALVGLDVLRHYVKNGRQVDDVEAHELRDTLVRHGVIEKVRKHPPCDEEDCECLDAIEEAGDAVGCDEIRPEFLTALRENKHI